jgi:hypothetical protein
MIGPGFAKQNRHDRISAIENHIMTVLRSNLRLIDHRTLQRTWSRRKGAWLLRFSVMSARTERGSKFPLGPREDFRRDPIQDSKLPIVIGCYDSCVKFAQCDRVLFAVRWSDANRKECTMKMNSAMVERTLSQFDANVIPDNHPAVWQLIEAFGDHTYFVDTAGLHIVEPAEPVEDETRTGVVVKLASWRDSSRASLVPHEPETTKVVIALGSQH